MESGVALSIMARPIRRSTVLFGKWLGLVAFGGGFVALAGLAQFVIVYVTTGYWPTNPVPGLALLAFQTAVLLTLGLLFSTLISPMASGVVAVGLFGATWIAGVVGEVGRGSRQRQRGRRGDRLLRSSCRPTGSGAARCTPSRTPPRCSSSAGRPPGRLPVPERRAADVHLSGLDDPSRTGNAVRRG